MSVLVALQGGAPATDFTGSWTQAPASWAATAEETLTSTASFTQAASWSATLAETLTATASFEQAAASWSASGAESLDTTATWTQTQGWAAEAAETLTSTASFVQPAATWDASAAVADNSFTGSWTQAQAWQATADTPVTGMGGRSPIGFTRDLFRRERPTLTERIPASAAIAQPPASWAAELDTYDPDILAYLFDEPALIGAR